MIAAKKILEDLLEGWTEIQVGEIQPGQDVVLVLPRSLAIFEGWTVTKATIQEILAVEVERGSRVFVRGGKNLEAPRKGGIFSWWRGGQR